MKPYGNGLSRRIFFLILVFTLMIACSIDQREQNGAPATNDDRIQVDRLKSDLRPLDLARRYRPTAAIENYFDYYGLTFSNVDHWFGSFQSGRERLAAHVFVPSAPAGTIFVLHGYLDHSGTARHLIAACLQRHFAVAVFDLPGHGLSTGPQAAIGDFSAYATALQDFLEAYGRDLPLPFHLIGHSTGCAIAYEYMQHVAPIPFDKVVFLAPLVRNAGWHWSVIGYRLAKPFVDTLPRKRRDNSTDPAFLSFIANDPLQGRRLSIQFLEALYAWNQRIQDDDVLAQPVLIIQGTDDAIVDWPYNLKFFGKKLRHLHVVMIEGGKHQLANESAAIRAKVLGAIFADLTPGASTE